MPESPHGLRAAVARASLPFATWLSSLPRPVPLLAVIALMVGGSLIPGWGWTLWAIIVVFLAWMLYLGWPALRAAERLMRLAVLAMVTAVTIIQAFPRS